LNQLAIDIGLDKLIVMTKYLNANTTNNNIYGNALEALMGAIYLDYGYKQCKKFVEDRLMKSFIDLDKVTENEVNFKSKLIEWCQKNRFETEFILVSDTLKSANKHEFLSQLLIQGVVICEATGNSKKDSQQNASKIACELINANDKFLKELKEKITFNTEISLIASLPIENSIE